MRLHSFHKFNLVWCLFGCGALLAAGCGGGGDSIELTDVSGKATFKGAPIAYGQIQFVPDANAQHEAPAGSAEIVDGAYNTAQGGKGIIPGKYEIRVTAYPSRPVVAAATESTEDVAAEPSVKPLFVGYTLNADLQSAQHDIDVPAEAEGFNLFEANAAPAGGNLP